MFRIWRRAKQTHSEAGALGRAVGERTVLLNREHLLPEYQSWHRLYDRFLPVLCKKLDHCDRWIIDVGANVGDTAVAIAQACRNPILCIEGDDGFFELLKYNVDHLFAKRERAVICIKGIAGSGRFCGPLQRDGTTARLAQTQAGGHLSATLDDLARNANVPAAEIA